MEHSRYTGHKNMRHTYGFEEISLVPGDLTINPDQTDIALAIERLDFPIPVLAAAMDGVVDVQFAIAMSKQGGLAVLNLEGVHARYDHPEEVLAQIVVVQSTVTTARHISKSYRGLIFSEVVKESPVPVIVGNCVSYSACRKLMETGIHGLLVGIGPGAACTTREVLGVGVPQATATMDCAAARDDYFRTTGRYVPIITDGGIRNGGDLCKSFACGADAVMLGSVLAQTDEAPGKGNHWGMAMPHEALPRGTRIKVGVKGSLEQTLFGPTSVTDGTQNLIGALRTSMGVCGARNIREMHQTEVVIAPSIRTEGKGFQFAQGLTK